MLSIVKHSEKSWYIVVSDSQAEGRGFESRFPLQTNIKTPVAAKLPGFFAFMGCRDRMSKKRNLPPQFHSHTQLAHDLLDPVLRGRKDPVKNIFLDGYAALKGKDAVEGFSF